MDDINDFPVITTQNDLHRLWRLLMGELGFGSRSLWMLLVDDEGRARPPITEIEDLPLRPEDDHVDSLLDLLEHLDAGSGAGIALLISRPGDAVDGSDAQWAAALHAAARARGVPLWPLHVATDRVLQVIAPDDLSRAG